MKQDEILQAAKEAGIEFKPLPRDLYCEAWLEQLEHLVAIIEKRTIERDAALNEARDFESDVDTVTQHNVELQLETIALKTENATAWAQAHRLALELECLLLDTKDNAIVSKWWDSGMAALNEYQQLKPGAKEDAEAWAKMRKEMK